MDSLKFWCYCGKAEDVNIFFILFQLVALFEEQAYLAKLERLLTIKYQYLELQWLGNPFETSPMQSAHLQHQHHLQIV